MKIRLAMKYDKIKFLDGVGHAIIETDLNLLDSALDDAEDISDIVPHRKTSEQVRAAIIEAQLSDASVGICLDVMRRAVRREDESTWEPQLVAAYLELGRELLNVAADNQLVPHLQDLAHKLRMMSGNAINGQVTP